MRPQTAQELWALLTGIFPGFAEDCPEEGAQSDATLHSVMREFTPYFSGNLETFSERHLKALARFINEAIATDDNLENAVSANKRIEFAPFGRPTHKVQRTLLAAHRRRYTATLT